MKKTKKVSAKDTKKKSKKKLIIILLVIIIILVIGFLLYKFYFKKTNTSTDTYTETTLNTIDNYGITLSDKDTEIYKEEYEKLKANLESGNIDYDAYAESIAKLFIIDLYTIDNKLNKYDVGGVEFVYPDNLDNYKLNVEDTLYKYVENNGDNKRTQELPEVKSISVESVKNTQYKINSENKTYDAYDFKLSWDYTKKNDYDDEGEVIVINKDNKMYVVEKN